MQSDHTPSAESRRKALVSQLLLTGGGVAVLLVAIGWMIYSAMQNPGRDASWAFTLICFGGILVPLGLFGVFTRWRNWQVGAVLYEKGFAYKDRSGVRQVSWGEIEAVWQNITRHYRNGVYTGTTYIYTVQTRDGEQTVLNNNLANIEQLGNAVCNHTAEALFPRYVQSLRNGHRLAFGPLSIDQDCIYNGSKSLRWQEIKALKIHQGVISVKKEGGWFNWASVRVPQVPNFYIFYELARRFVTVE